jgi:hypothetical protein
MLQPSDLCLHVGSGETYMHAPAPHAVRFSFLRFALDLALDDRGAFFLLLFFPFLSYR